MKEKINKETTLAEILKNPRAEEVLAEYRVPCLGCQFAQFEMQKLTIGQICQMYGIALGKLLKDLNSDKIKKW